MHDAIFVGTAHATGFSVCFKFQMKRSGFLCAVWSKIGLREVVTFNTLRAGDADLRF